MRGRPEVIGDFGSVGLAVAIIVFFRGDEIFVGNFAQRLRP